MSQINQQLSTDHTEASLRALEGYAHLGIPVVMLFGVVKGERGWTCECPRAHECESPGKHPRRKGWRKAASTNGHLLSRVFRSIPNANLAIATSGLAVLDFDPRHGGDESERRFVQAHGKWPETAEVHTGGGGRHLYFRADGWRVGNSLPALNGYPGIDVRGRGGYVVAPPSRHITGVRYRWVNALDVEIPPLPSSLTEGLVADLQATPRPDGVTPYAWAALAGEYEKVATAKRGRRNLQLYAASCNLGEVVGSDDVDEDIVWDYLQEAASLCGLDTKEAEATIRSGLAKGRDNPRPSKRPFKSRDDAMNYLKELRAVAQRLKWSGHAGKRQITVLEALIRIAMRAGGPGNFAKGIRGIKLEAGFASNETVMTALKELQDQGWVQQLFVGNSSERPSRWRLQIPEAALQDLNEVTPPLEGGVVQAMQHPQLPVGHDVFRGWVRGKYVPQWGRHVYIRGSDKTAWRILELLLNEPQPSRRAIAKVIGIHPSTAGRVVRRLIDGGLVADTEEGLVATVGSMEDLDNLAREHGTHGAAVKQRQTLGWMTAELPELDPCPHTPRCPKGYVGCDQRAG